MSHEQDQDLNLEALVPRFGGGMKAAYSFLVAEGMPLTERINKAASTLAEAMKSAPALFESEIEFETSRDATLSQLALELDAEAVKRLREAVWSKTLSLTVRMEYAKRYEKARLDGAYEALKEVWELLGGDKKEDGAPDEVPSA